MKIVGDLLLALVAVWLGLIFGEALFRLDEIAAQIIFGFFCIVMTGCALWKVGMVIIGLVALTDES